MSSFQSQIRQLRKTTRNRISEAGSRITTEIADEAVLMHARAVRMSHQAARISSRAIQRVSFVGEVPPPPPFPQHTSLSMEKESSLESGNPMYHSSDSSQPSPQIKPTNQSGTRPRQSKRTSTMRRGSAKASSGTDVRSKKFSDTGGKGDMTGVGWLISKARKVSVRFSYRELPKDHEDYQPKMFSAPIPPLWATGSKNQTPTTSDFDAQVSSDHATGSNTKSRALRPDLHAPVPPGFDDDSSSKAPNSVPPRFDGISTSSAPVNKVNPRLQALLSVPSTPKIPKLNLQFEEFRMREFRACLNKPKDHGNQKSVNPNSQSGKGFWINNPAKVEVKESKTEVPAGKRIEALRKQFEKETKHSSSGSSNSVASSSQMTSTVKSSPLKASSSSSSITGSTGAKPTALKPATSFIKHSGGGEAIKFDAPKPAGVTIISQPTHKTVSPLDVTPAKIVLNDSFEKIRMREFTRRKEEYEGRVRQRVMLKADFEKIRQREFTRIPLEINARKVAALTVTPQSQQVQENKDDSRQNDQPRSARTSIINKNTAASNSRVIKRGSISSLADIPVLVEDAGLGQNGSSYGSDSNQFQNSQQGAQMPRMSGQIPPGRNMFSLSEDEPSTHHQRNPSRNFQEVPAMSNDLGNIWSGFAPLRDSSVQMNGNDPSLSPSAQRGRHVRADLFVDAVPQDIIPSPAFSPINSSQPAKRGSLVTRAFRVISGIGAGSSAPAHAVSPPPGMRDAPSPPAFPFDNFQLLQLDMQQAEQQMQFKEYTRLSTVYETRNDYMDSFSSSAAEAWDRERKLVNASTL